MIGEENSGSVRQSDIQLVLFLSKLLNPAEKNYWPTELEVACLVWAVKKLRHHIKTARKTVVFTDYAATLGVASQTTMKSVNSDKLNKRLIWASQYLSQYNIDVKHKPRQTNIIPDVLSRLASQFKKADTHEGALEELLTYNCTLVEIAEEFQIQLKEAYHKDSQWERIMDMLTVKENEPDIQEETQELGNEGNTTQILGINFQLCKGLLYHIGDTGKQRLCIPKELEKEIFKLSHDQRNHSGFYRTYKHIAEAMYIRHLARRLQKYIEHCSTCQVFQTKHHKPYRELKPIQSPRILFHTLTIDFILGLPEDQDCNYALSITDKFSKAVMVLPGRDTHSAQKWAKILLLGLTDWGVPRSIISDRDLKFLSDL